MSQARVHILVSGVVQGVFFRQSTQKQATSLGLAGWVRNLHDGRVEILAEGEKDALEQLVQWAHTGPPAAHVDQVETKWPAYQGDLQGFHVAGNASSPLQA